MKKPNRIETIFVMIDSFMGSAASFLSDMSVTSIEGMQVLSEGASSAMARLTLRSANAAMRSAQWSYMAFKGSPASISFLGWW